MYETQKKYKCKTIITSQLMPDDKRVTFQPGDVIDERFIAPKNIKEYIKSRLLVEIKENSNKVD